MILLAAGNANFQPQFFGTFDKEKKGGPYGPPSYHGSGMQEIFLLNGHTLSGLPGMIPSSAAVVERE